METLDLKGQNSVGATTFFVDLAKAFEKSTAQCRVGMGFACWVPHRALRVLCGYFRQLKGFCQKKGLGLDSGTENLGIDEEPPSGRGGRSQEKRNLE